MYCFDPKNDLIKLATDVDTIVNILKNKKSKGAIHKNI